MFLQKEKCRDAKLTYELMVLGETYHYDKALLDLALLISSMQCDEREQFDCVFKRCSHFFAQFGELDRNHN